LDESLPPELRAEELVSGGMRYILPARSSGILKGIGLFAFVLGLLFAILPVLQILEILREGRGTFFIAFLIPFALSGLVPILIGVFSLAGHTEVRLTTDTLTTTEKAGPIRYSRSRPASGLARFQILGLPAESDTGQPMPAALTSVSALTAVYDPGKGLLLAFGYPRELMVAVANALAGRLGLEIIDEASRERKPAVEVVEPESPAKKVSERVEQPKGSQALLEEHANGMTISFPAAGILRGSKGMFGFGLVWCAFMGVFSSVIVLAGESDVDFVFYAFIGLFWLIGIGMLVGAINMGLRQAVLAVLDGDLAIIQKGLFGTKRSKWAREELSAIRSGPTGMEVNGKPVIELQVHLEDGKKVGLLSERSNPELDWAATVLRNALEVPAK